MYGRIFFKYLLAQTVNLKSERYDETRVFTLRTRRISNFPSFLPLEISAFQCAVFAINVSITNAFPPESRETQVQHKLFKYKMTYGKTAPHFAYRSSSIIQFTTMLNQVAHLERVPYVDLRLPPTWISHWQYSPVTMLVPASGHQVRCIPWLQMGTFNKEIGFLCGLKFFTLNIFCGEYRQSSLHLMLQIWWKPLPWKMCQ